MSFRERTLIQLRQMQPKVVDWTDETQLVGSDAIDSFGLMELALWVENQLGRPLDPSSFDLASEWRTVGKLVAFLNRDGRPSR